jgi:V8-like Glu-specific endopeptidase
MAALRRGVGVLGGLVSRLSSGNGACPIIAGALLGVIVLGPSLPSTPAGASMPSARSFAGVPAVGALFTYGAGGLGTHFCTASVVDSPAEDLVITAAHCVSGHQGAMVFVPGYDDGDAPDGIWSVVRVVVDEHWQSSDSPDDDFAFLVVKRLGKGGDSLEALTGGERLGVDDPAPALVRVFGYPNGAQAPIRCANKVFDFSPTQLQFDCGGYTQGTSGSPLVAGVDPRTGTGTVVGVIGGYQLGGDTPQVSYAAKFGGNLAELYASALKEAPRG